MLARPLRFDFGEVTHFELGFWLMVDGSDSNAPNHKHRSIISNDAGVCFFDFPFLVGMR